VTLKKASKAFAGRFAASANVGEGDEVCVTGDHSADIAEVITSKFPEVPADKIVFKEGKAKKK
jgi:translation initiation factor 1 (eIF-1/SUI1)